MKKYKVLVSLFPWHPVMIARVSVTGGTGIRPGATTRGNPIALGGGGGRIMRPGVQDHPGQHSETSSLLKIQKISRV